MASKKSASRRTDGISYRTYDDSWYSSITGEYKPLRDEAGNKIKGRDAEPEAKKAYARLVLAIGKGGVATTTTFTVGQVADTYLDFLRNKREPRSYDVAKQYLTDWVRYVGDTRPAGDVKRRELTDWIEGDGRGWKGHEWHWGPSAINRAMGCVVSAYYYALKREMVEKNQFAEVERPQLQHRVTLISPEQEAAFYAVSERKNSQLCDFVWFQIQTGCRPAEAAKIEAKHLRETGEGVQVVLPAFDEDGKLGHKTGRKTGKARVIYCTADASAMLRRLAAKYPAGPLFRTKRGNEWGEDNRGDQFANARKRVQAKYGEDFMGDDIVMYSCRHTFATRKLAQGYSIEIVAELLGNSVKVCLQHYAHLNLCGNTLWQAIKGNGIGAQAQPAIAVAG